MQPRPLITDNRILRLTSADDLRVSLGRAVTEMAETPMTGALINRSFKQAQAASRALTETQREEFAQAERERRSRQSAIEYNLDNETDPSKRENLLSQLDGIYQEKDTQKDAIFQQAIDEGRLQTPEDLTEKYGDLLEFDEMMTDEEARLLYQGKKKKLFATLLYPEVQQGLLLVLLSLVAVCWQWLLIRSK